MNLQAIFDKGVEGIFAQGGPSMDHDNEGCMYRGLNNAKCALGHSIPDEKYGSWMEGCTPALITQGLKPSDKVAAILGCENEHDARDLREFQRCHDSVASIGLNGKEFLIRFAEQAENFAERYRLNTSVLQACQETLNGRN